MLGNRYSQHSFAKTPDVNLGRSQFDRSFTVKDTFDADWLTPCFVDEILPGDTCNVKLNAFARLSTQIKPIMDNIYIDFFFFFVPNRLVWVNWEKFNGAQTDPGDPINYTVPIINYKNLTTGVIGSTGTIFEKFGLPIIVNNVNGVNINALPFRGYNLIWNEWFRDQNMVDSLDVYTDNGPDLTTEYQLWQVMKKHDYFTSCLTAPQKGTAIDIPLSASNLVTLVPYTTNNNAMIVRKRVDDTILPSEGIKSDGSTLTNDAGSTSLTIDPNSRLTVDMSSSATINQLREAFQIQSLLELDNRSGTRYVEILQAHFGVISPDFRLQRPEYLGGGQIRINSHVVPQTSKTDGTAYQANLAAFATGSSAGKDIGFTKSFVEHGFVIGVMVGRADITYQQGVNRMWSRSTRYDYFWPKLQEIGEQAVLNKEIFLLGTSTQDDDVFGYQERYAEYKYKPSEIHGLYRSDASGTLDVWHLAEDFAAVPNLDIDFIASNTPMDRVVADTNAPHFLIDMFYEYKHARPMLSYSVPASLGRF